MEKQALSYALLEERDKNIYLDLVNTPYWREIVDDINRVDEIRLNSVTYNILTGLASFLTGSYYGNGKSYGLILYATIRGRFFHADQQRARRIQKFLKEMQVKYDCDSIDPTGFPGVERWQ